MLFSPSKVSVGCFYFFSRGSANRKDVDHRHTIATFIKSLLSTELAKVDPSVSVLCDVHNTLVNTVLRKYATDYLKDKYLPQLSTDQVRSLPLPSHAGYFQLMTTFLLQLGSFCLSEPASGSDAFAMKTTATKSADGSYYTLSGSKMWITNSAEAGLFLVSLSSAFEAFFTASAGINEPS